MKNNLLAFWQLMKLQYTIVTEAGAGAGASAIVVHFKEKAID